MPSMLDVGVLPRWNVTRCCLLSFNTSEQRFRKDGAHKSETVKGFRDQLTNWVSDVIIGISVIVFRAPLKRARVAAFRHPFVMGDYPLKDRLRMTYFI